MRASTIGLDFALLGAKSEGVFIAKHDGVGHFLEAATLLPEHVAQADSERVGCDVVHGGISWAVIC
jgi:hypothetical protein